MEFSNPAYLEELEKRMILKKNCPNRTFRSGFAKLGSEILYLFLPKKWSCLLFLFFFVILLCPILTNFFFKLKLSTSWERCCQGKIYSVLSQPARGPGSENYAQILQLYKELPSRRKVRFRQTFFQIELRKVLYKEVMVINPHDLSGRIPSPSKLGKMQKCKKIKNSKTCPQCYNYIIRDDLCIFGAYWVLGPLRTWSRDS